MEAEKIEVALPRIIIEFHQGPQGVLVKLEGVKTWDMAIGLLKMASVQAEFTRNVMASQHIQQQQMEQIQGEMIRQQLNGR